MYFLGENLYPLICLAYHLLYFIEHISYLIFFICPSQYLGFHLLSNASYSHIIAHRVLTVQT